MSLNRKDSMQVSTLPQQEKLSLSVFQLDSIKTVTPLICHFMTRYCNDKKRRRILCEMIQTERSYVNSLEALIEVYYDPLQLSIQNKSGIIDQDSFNKLLGSYNRILSLHKNEILTTMDECLPELEESFPSHQAFLKISNKFIEIFPRLRVAYLYYLENNLKADELLTKLKKNRKFKNFLNEALFNPKSKCQEIDDFLILPTQRMASYKLLFERIIKNFPLETHQKEREQYTLAYESLVQIGKEMNSESNDQASKDLLRVAEKIGKVPKTFVIMKPRRRFLGKFDCSEVLVIKKKNITKYQLYVMSDIIVITVRDEWSVFSATKVHFYDAIPISEIHFAPKTNVLNEEEKIFSITASGKEYQFTAKNSIERDNFVFKLRKVQKQIYNRVEKMSELGMAFITKNMSEIHDSYFNPDKLPSRLEAIQSLK